MCSRELYWTLESYIFIHNIAYQSIILDNHTQPFSSPMSLWTFQYLTLGVPCPHFGHSMTSLLEFQDLTLSVSRPQFLMHYAGSAQTHLF
ncbi:hypothetical protein NPIL_615461 [Nephila pilipes]|uniref:Uncharacterized protein n=1 Tax=Nephila pilipes TaxID=299642 RepID=A0A8X6NA77_NEPPI|nr:hypothetical protein NPIL_615461 [Nephila pilipes]